MPRADEIVQRTFLEYAALDRVSSAFLRSWEFRSAKWLCVLAAGAAAAAVAFATAGVIEIENKKADIRDQLEKAGEKAKAELSAIVQDAKTAAQNSQRILAETTTEIANQRGALESTIAAGKEQINSEVKAFATSNAQLKQRAIDDIEGIKKSFKDSNDELSKNAVKDIVRDIEAGFSRKDSALSAQVSAATQNVKAAEDGARALKGQIDDLSRIIKDNEKLGQQVEAVRAQLTLAQSAGTQASNVLIEINRSKVAAAGDANAAAAEHAAAKQAAADAEKAYQRGAAIAASIKTDAGAVETNRTNTARAAMDAERAKVSAEGSAVDAKSAADKARQSLPQPTPQPDDKIDKLETRIKALEDGAVKQTPIVANLTPVCSRTERRDRCAEIQSALYKKYRKSTDPIEPPKDLHDGVGGPTTEAWAAQYQRELGPGVKADGVITASQADGLLKSP